MEGKNVQSSQEKYQSCWWSSVGIDKHRPVILLNKDIYFTAGYVCYQKIHTFIRFCEKI